MTTEPDTSQWKRTPDGIPIPPPSPDDVLYESLDGFVRITMNRPIVLNALNKSMQRGIDAALDRAEADEQVKAVILTGAGRAFSRGGDMWSSLYPDDDPAPSGLDILMRIWSFPMPVIAAVRGHAVGLGCQLAGVCDLTIASETARIGELQIRNGLAAPVLITPFLTGPKQAKELMLLGDVLDAHDALRIGLVNRVVPDDELDAEAEAMARKLAALPENAVRLNKAVINRVYELMGFREATAYPEDDAIRTLTEAGNDVAEAGRRVRETDGWAAFKCERDRGYEEAP